MPPEGNAPVPMFYAQMVFGALAFWSLLAYAMGADNKAAFGAALVGCGSIVLSQTSAMAGALKAAYLFWLASFAAAAASFVLL